MKDPWVAGVLANSVWSFGGTPGLGGPRYNSFLTQPFANYNFGKGWYVGSAPIITATWPSPDNKSWTVPIGAQAGRVVKVGGKLPVNFAVGAYHNAVRPEFGAPWQLRTQVTFIFQLSLGIIILYVARVKSEGEETLDVESNCHGFSSDGGARGRRDVRRACATAHGVEPAGGRAVWLELRRGAIFVVREHQHEREL
jgi:hypothetical protein